MTEPKIADLLENFGIAISSGQISAWLTPGYRKKSRRKAGHCGSGPGQQPDGPPLWGLSAGQHMDNNGTRVDGESYHCQILCNPLYGAYFTTARKDRLTIIDVLRNGRPRIYKSMGKLWICCTGLACRSGLPSRQGSCRSIRTGARRSCSAD
jgi:hypothetical protein